MISTRELSGLPDAEGFCTLTKSLAMLDAVLSPEWEYRYYSFNSGWDRSKGEMLASMRNGEGDLWFAVLCSAGVALHGLAHDAPTFIPGKPQPWVFRDLPPEFHESLLHEPAADTANSTFCIWRRVSDSAWHTGIRQPGEDRGDDGSARLLAILSGDPQVYVGFAAEYYETDIALEDVRAVYEHRPLDAALVSRLNQAADFEQMLREAPEIGYPAVAI